MIAPIDKIKLGSDFDSLTRGTILGINLSAGTVDIAVEDLGINQVKQNYKVPIPGAWFGSEGEFLGGFPKRGTTCLLQRSPGGQYYIVGTIPSKPLFLSTSLMNDLKPDRILARVKDGTKLILDPKEGIKLGTDLSKIQLDTSREIYINDFKEIITASESKKHISGIVYRISSTKLSKDQETIYTSTLTDSKYRNSLKAIGLDSSSNVSYATSSGKQFRNPALTEDKEIIYETAFSYDYLNNDLEKNQYLGENNSISIKEEFKRGRRNNKTDSFSLNKNYPNYLIQTIKGTAVDIFGNILDINRFPLEIGKNQISLKNSNNIGDSFSKILDQHKNALAFSFEINTKSGISSFFLDVNKEGQFKINVPASSNAGNIALFTNYKNYSTLLNEQDKNVNTNSFIENEANKDIYQSSFSNSEDFIDIKTLGNYPIDFLTGKKINLNTPFHNILNTISLSQNTKREFLINYAENHPLNSVSPISNIISKTISIGENSGGRSANINLEGSAVLSIGANIIDNQSLWTDYKGSVVSNIGRDKNNLSYLLSTDGDVYLQIGGKGSNSTTISRTGILDIKVVDEKGQISGIRFSNGNIELYCPGTVSIVSGQEQVYKSEGSDIKVTGENVVFFPGKYNRIVQRKPASI